MQTSEYLAAKLAFLMLRGSLGGTSSGEVLWLPDSILLPQASAIDRMQRLPKPLLCRAVKLTSGRFGIECEASPAEDQARLAHRAAISTVTGELGPWLISFRAQTDVLLVSRGIVEELLFDYDLDGIDWGISLRESVDENNVGADLVITYPRSPPDPNTAGPSSHPAPDS